MASNGKKGSGNAAPTQNEQKKPNEQAEKKNDAVQSETVQPIPEISVRIDKLFDDDTKKLKAFASANVGPFAVHGIRVFENEKGMFVSMPSVSYKDGQGNTQYDEVFHPVSKDARQALVENVVNAYEKALEQSQTANQTVAQSTTQTMQRM